MTLTTLPDKDSGKPGQDECFSLIGQYGLRVKLIGSVVLGSTSPPEEDRQRDAKDPMEALQAAASALFRRFNEAGGLPSSAAQVFYLTSSLYCSSVVALLTLMLHMTCPALCSPCSTVDPNREA